MDKYVHLTDLSTKTFDDTLTVNTRTGGVFTSIYSKPISKFFIGQVSINIFSDYLNVYCPSVQRDDKLPIEGNVTNVYKIKNYTLYCVIGDQEYPLELSSTNRWSFKLSSQLIYMYSLGEITLKLVGSDLNNNPFTITNSIPINIQQGCKTTPCNIGSISFDYYKKDVYDTVYTVNIDGNKVQVKGLDELKTLFEENNLSFEVIKND